MNTTHIGQKVQFAMPPEAIPVLNNKGTKRFQAITRTFQYYAKTIDPTIILAVRELASQQGAPTETTIEMCNMLRYYAHTYPTATFRYYASDMCLHVEYDVAYLVQPRARSWVAGHFYFNDRIPTGTSKPNPKPNGTIITECRTVRNVISSAAEAETIDIFTMPK